MNGTLYQTRFGSFLFQSDIDLIKSSGSIILNSFTEIFFFVKIRTQNEKPDWNGC